MTEEKFRALFYRPEREHDPLVVALKAGGRHMVTGFDGTHAELFGGAKVPIAGLRHVGGVELREG